MMSKTSIPTDALLLTLGELVRKELSAELLLHRIVDVMARLLEAERGTVFVLDDASDELVAVAAHLPELQTLRVPRSQGVAGYVARTGRVVNFPHDQAALTDEDGAEIRIWREVDARTGYQTRTMLAGPLRDQAGHLIGVAQFLNKRDGVFSAGDEASFALLSEQVARLLEATTLSSAPDFFAPSTASRAAPCGDDDESQPGALSAIGSRINHIVGTGAAMRRIFAHIRRVAPTGATVLLRGESGTGKGLVARAIHHNSARRDGALVHVDCTTLPGELMENELFGHERGAYTGADKRTEGKVAQARGGTLFLDEIGDLAPALQGKLLTLVQERHYHRVGGTEQLAADIRIVAATNRDLEGLVACGRFREDLYYRLRVVQLALPPLRARGRDDLRQLINHFVAQAARRHARAVHRIDPDALELLLEYPWPGNVRELENCLESAVIFSERGRITADALALPRAPALTPRPPLPDAALPLGEGEPGESTLVEIPANPRPRGGGGREAAGGGLAGWGDEPSLRELEGRYIAWLLERHAGNRSACARVLGIGRNTLLRKMREHDLE